MVEEISERERNNFMAIAEQMMHRGLEQGALEKSIRIAKRLITEGSNPTFVMKVTGLSLDKIKELQKTIK